MKIATMIGSCDDYCFLWKNFDTLFKKYCFFDTKKYLVTEDIKNFSTDYQIISPGKLPWGARLLTCLNQIEEDYVFFILDDYYFNTIIDQTFIDNQIECMEKYSADKIIFHPGDDLWWATLHSLEEDLSLFDLRSQYLNSVQPAIWRVDYLKKALLPIYNPWEFELNGNNHSASLNPKILLRKLPKPMYFNLVRKGKVFSKGAVEFLKSENLTIGDL